MHPTTYVEYWQALVESALERLGSGLDSTMDDVFAELDRQRRDRVAEAALAAEQTIITAATMRLARSGSFRNTTAITAANSTLVSRSAATMAIGATVMAQITIQ